MFQDGKVITLLDRLKCNSESLHPGNHHPKPNGMCLHGGGILYSGRRATVLRIDEPRTASSDAVPTGIRACGVCKIVNCLWLGMPVAAPFRDITVHVVKPKCIGALLSHWMSLEITDGAIQGVITALAEVRVVAILKACSRPRSSGILSGL